MAGKCWSAGKDFLTSLIEREIMIAACEVASGTKTSDAVRVATIMDHAPEPLKATLCQSPLDQRHSVDALNLLIQGASCVLPGLFQGQVSLQESAVGDGGKGKKRQKARRARRRSSTRARTSMAARARIETTLGMELRPADSTVPRLLLSLCQVGSQARRVENTVGSTESWRHMSSWCLAAVTTPRGAAGTMLVDSGAQYHICHPEFAKEPRRKRAQD